VTCEPNLYERLDPVPAVPPQANVLDLRDALRDLFALLGITATVRADSAGSRRVIVVSPLSLGDARKLLRALDSSPLTQARPR
jgi:hypothetical protein